MSVPIERACAPSPTRGSARVGPVVCRTARGTDRLLHFARGAAEPTDSPTFAQDSRGHR